MTEQAQKIQALMDQALHTNRLHWAEYHDPAQNTYRSACFHKQRVEACLFITRDLNKLPASHWLLNLFAKEELSPAERAFLLSASSPTPCENKGKIICSCFSVGENTLQKSIKQNQLNTVQDIGKQLMVGTNCGSCIPELQILLQENAA